jgi:hypothetical protein
MAWLKFKAKHRLENPAAAYRTMNIRNEPSPQLKRRNNTAATIATVNAPMPTTNTENHLVE